MDAISSNHINHRDFQTLERTMVINGVETRILHPEANFDPEGILAKVKGENNNSMVIKTTFGSTSVLFPGDICEQAEEELISRNMEDLPSTVLVCPHHGSKSSSTMEFINRVNPQYVVITVGWRNRFNFPHSEVLERYRHQGSHILRTDLDGAVAIRSDGKRLRVDSCRKHL